MNICGIICEYNPFHNGHLYHINETKKITGCDAIVGIMSGNFVQRGMPAFIDKWSRAKMALNNGIDLMIELPSIYSLSSAEFFAYGAVSLLDSLGSVNSISFGSECGEINTLKNAADIFINEPLSYNLSLKENLALGISFHKSRSNALKSYLEQNHNKYAYEYENILKNPNNCLGIEYCKSILKLNSNIIPYTIKRFGNCYNDCNLDDSFPSATAIREYIKQESDYSILSKYVPSDVLNDIIIMKQNDYEFVSEQKIFYYLKYKLMLFGENIKNIPDVAEGLDNKIIKSIGVSKNYDEFVKCIKSKRYTYSRISRILCQYFLGFEQYNTARLRKESCPYARVLGFTKRGTEILKILKHTSKIPIYIKLPKNPCDVLKLDLKTTYAYSMLNPQIKNDSDYTISPLHFI